MTQNLKKDILVTLIRPKQDDRMDTSGSYSQPPPRSAYSKPEEKSYSQPMSTDEDYRIRSDPRSDPRKDPRSASYDSRPAKRSTPDNGEYVPSTIDKYMKGTVLNHLLNVII